MNKEVVAVLDRFFAAGIEHAVELPSMEDLERQRAAFLANFGPERLAAMTKTELLRQIPYNASNEQSMDHWLISKNDAEFCTALFGNAKGGSRYAMGPWQSKKTGLWHTLHPGMGWDTYTVGEDEAVSKIEARRTEMINAVGALQPFLGQRTTGVDARKVQAALEEAAPIWSMTVWLHKYLHIVLPELVMWTTTVPDAQAMLYRVGERPLWKGLFALDTQIIQFWSSVPSLANLPVALKYRVAKGLHPRNHFCLGMAGDIEAWKEMIANGYLALGPERVGNLAEFLSASGKRDFLSALDAAFRDTSTPVQKTDSRNLARLFKDIEEGSLVALLSDSSTVVAVGTVIGGYRHVPGARRPHQVPVRWHHSRCFEVSTAVHSIGTKLVKLEPTDAVVADIEASLLINGIGPDTWIGFGSHNSDAEPPSSRPGSVGSLPHPEGITRHVLEMLERKRQVILYGPPGTGKTYHAERIALELVARHNFGRLPTQLTEKQRDTIYARTGNDPHIAACTFHPAYSYEDFIEGYRPVADGFKLEHGIFRKMATAAQAQPDKRFVLVIDEINRGNIPKIFGELITLLEASKRGTTKVWLPLSKDPFTVPDNLFIIGTMNTADRSILLLDTALRRRFAFKELLPDYRLLRTTIAGMHLATWLVALNRRIVEQLGRDGRNLQVGHAYLMPGGRPVSTISRMGEIVRDELWPLLQEYCYEDPHKLAAILAADKGGVFDHTTANLRYDLFEPGREEDLAESFNAIIAPEDVGPDDWVADGDPDDDETGAQPDGMRNE